MRRLLFRLVVWWAANRAAFHAALDAQLRGASFGTSIAMGENQARRARREAQEAARRRESRTQHLVAGDQVAGAPASATRSPSSIDHTSSED